MCLCLRYCYSAVDAPVPSRQTLQLNSDVVFVGDVLLRKGCDLVGTTLHNDRATCWSNATSRAGDRALCTACCACGHNAC